MFAKTVLCTPATNNQRHCFVMSSVLLDHLHLWGIHNLWTSLLDDLKACKSRGGVSHGLFCKSCALFWARERRYNNAIQSLSSQGVGGHNDDSAFDNLLRQHLSSPCPDENVVPSKPALTVDGSIVLSCLRAFPKSTIPGAFKLRAQHLLDAIAALAAHDSLFSLTCLMNHLLSGKFPFVFLLGCVGLLWLPCWRKVQGFAQLQWVRWLDALQVDCVVLLFALLSQAFFSPIVKWGWEFQEG